MQKEMAGMRICTKAFSLLVFFFVPPHRLPMLTLMMDSSSFLLLSLIMVSFVFPNYGVFLIPRIMFSKEILK